MRFKIPMRPQKTSEEVLLVRIEGAQDSIAIPLDSLLISDKSGTIRLEEYLTGLSGVTTKSNPNQNSNANFREYRRLSAGEPPSDAQLVVTRLDK